MAAQTLKPTARNLARLARALREGELVAVPTETVYGLAGSALEPKACRAIFRAKGRPSTDPLIIHIHDAAQLDALAKTNAAAKKLAKAFWPGPLTLVLPKKPLVPDVVTSGQASVAIRMPSHPTFRKLLQLAGIPLAAPSANPFGYVSPTSAEHVAHGLGKRIPFILDGGAAEIGLESTIVDLRHPERPVILRPGAIDRAALEKVLKVRVGQRARTVEQGPAETPALAPGMLTRHYSPRTPLALHARLTPAHVIAAGPKEAFVFIAQPSENRARSGLTNTFYLSRRGDLKEAARALFATLRQLDGEGWKRIHFELAPGESGLAVAINDRLTRAAARA